MKFLRNLVTFASVALTITIHGRDASNIGTYNIGFDYSHASGDNYDSNSFSVGSNLAFHLILVLDLALLTQMPM